MYNLKIKTLEPQYYDVDTVMLHACFNLLVTYIEDETPDYVDIKSYNTNKQNLYLAEAHALYYWWKYRRTISSLQVQDQFDIDNQMLKRLIEIRHTLWT